MRSPLALTLLLLLALGIIIGGASSQGILGNALLQVLAALLIAWMILIPAPDALSGPDLWLRWTIVAATLLAAAQFMPLPPALWTLLPGREGVAEGFRLLGMPLPWQTLSLAPWNSLASLTWCLPAIAMFMGARRATSLTLAACAQVIVALAVVSAALGIMQQVSGVLYFYPITNYGAPVGFFANVNHQASFLICALLLWTAHYAGGERSRAGQMRMKALVYFGIALFLIIGVILCGSLAATGLLVMAIAGCGMILLPHWRPRPLLITASFAIFTSAALAFGYFGSTSYGFVLDTEVPGMSRADFWRNGLAMIAAYMPLGSGLGTFEQAYPLFEDPHLVDSTYVNHAHNDFLELTIEGGLFALGLIAAFLAWLAKRCLGLIGRPEDPGVYALLLVIGVLTLHSLVDYPLRTAALSLVFALALGFLTRSRTPGTEETRRRR